MDLINRVTYDYADLDEAFPACDPGVEPFGSRLLVQIRTPKKKTKGGIILQSGGDTQETEFWTTQVAKVLKVGPLAFKNRNTLESWPEGSWCAAGDFVRIPKFGGDRWTVTLSGSGDDKVEALIVIFNDLDVIGKITGDPTTMKAFI